MVHSLDPNQPETAATSQDNVRHMPNRLQIYLWLALMLLGLVAALWNYQSFQLGTWHDDANYVLLAQSILESDKYGQINRPGEPTNARYPFGYPLLLAPLIALFPGNWDVLKGLSLLTTLLNGAILFWGWHWFSRRSRWWGLAAAGFYLLAPLTIEHTRMIMAEPVFTMFSLIAIIATEQAAQRQEGRFWLGVTAVSLVFVAFSRTIGIAMVGGIFVYLLWRRGWGFWRQLALVSGAMAVLVTAVMLVTPVRIANGLFPARYLEGVNATFINATRSLFNRDTAEETLSERYVQPENGEDVQIDRGTLLRDYLEGVRSHLGKDVRLAVIQIGSGAREQELANRVGMPWLPALFGFLVTAVVALGFFRDAFRYRMNAFMLFAVLYLAVLMVWVWDGPRLLYPVMATFFYGFLLGVEAVLRLAGRVIRPLSQQKVITAVLVILFVGVMGLHLEKDLTMKDSRVHVGDLGLRTAWIKENTPETAVVLSDDPYVDFLYGGRLTERYPKDLETPDDLGRYLAEANIDYVLVAFQRAWQDDGYRPFYSKGSQNMLILLNGLAGQVTLVHEDEAHLIQVYEVRP